MYIVIVGGGKVGEALARTLAGRKHQAVVIEKDDRIANKVAEGLEGIMVISGDGCDPLKLEDAGIDRADVVAAVTGDDEDNLVICQLAKESYNVKKTIARINNPRNERTFQKLGIAAVSSTAIISKLIEEEATVGDIVTLLSLKKGKLAIVEAELTSESPVVNQRVKDIKLPTDCVLTSIIRGGQVIFPKGDTLLKPKDSVIALSTSKQEKELKKVLLGKV